MSYNPESSSKKQIISLITTLFGAVLTAFLLALGMLYYYSPNGAYLAQNSLLAPEMLNLLNSGKNKAPQFEKFEYIYQNFTTQKQETLPVNKEQYSQFYTLVSNDRSLVDVPAELIADFTQTPLATLNLLTTVDGQSQLFQTIQLLYQGNYYRIELRQSSPGNNWIYFEHPDIYKDTYNLFTK